MVDHFIDSFIYLWGGINPSKQYEDRVGADTGFKKGGC